MWFAIYDINTRELKSTGTVVADDDTLAANGFAKKALSAQPDFATHQWDTVTLDMVPLPAPASTASARVSTFPPPFDRPSANPTNREIMEGLIAIHQRLDALIGGPK